MRCVICNKTIGKNEERSYVLARRTPTSKDYKVYACSKCQDAFDAWINSKAIFGNFLLDTGR